MELSKFRLPDFYFLTNLEDGGLLDMVQLAQFGNRGVVLAGDGAEGLPFLHAVIGYIGA